MTDNTSSQYDGVPLSDMIEKLRSELALSLQRGKGALVGFAVDKVELELKVAVSQKTKGEGGIAFWVVKAGASVEAQKDNVHTFRISMTPVSGITGKRLDIHAKAASAPTTD